MISSRLNFERLALLLGPKSPTILCIDDESRGLTVRKLLLETQGYTVLTAESGPAGLELLSADKIDAVVVDFRMEPMDGLEVAKRIRREHGVWIPIVLLSGYLGEIPSELLHIFDACLTKGNASEELFAELRRLVRKQPIKPPRDAAAPGVKDQAS